MENPTFIDDKLVSEPPCIEDFPVPSLMTPEGTRLWQRIKWGRETGPGPVGPVGHPVGIPGCRFVYNSHELSLFAYHKTHDIAIVLSIIRTIVKLDEIEVIFTHLLSDFVHQGPWASSELEHHLAAVSRQVCDCCIQRHVPGEVLLLCRGGQGSRS
jgi:hypothetical protein